MKTGRPKKLRIKKSFSRRRFRKGKNPKQLAATMGRRRVRKARRR